MGAFVYNQMQSTIEIEGFRSVTINRVAMISRSRWIEFVLPLFALCLTAVCAGGAFAQSGWRASKLAEAAGKDLNTVYFLDSKRGWIGGDGGLVLHTEDAGSSWTSQQLRSESGVNDIYFRDKENGFLLTGNRIFSTRDSGLSWRESQLFDESRFNGMPELYSIRFTGKNKGWVVGSVSRGDAVVDSLVLYTDDAGVSWKRVKAPSREELIHIDFVSDRRGWIVGVAGTILYTGDAGDTWTIQRTGTQAALYHVDFRNEDRGWAVGEKGTILRTTVGGGEWAPTSTQFKNTILSVQFIDDKRGWAAGRGGLIIRSEDGGVTWLPQATGTTQNIYALFVENKNVWAVGADGLVLQLPR
jgi:photosystem II stability/assembly factor-like uncharacterized protein